MKYLILTTLLVLGSVPVVAANKCYNVVHYSPQGDILCLNEVAPGAFQIEMKDSAHKVYAIYKVKLLKQFPANNGSQGKIYGPSAIGTDLQERHNVVFFVKTNSANKEFGEVDIADRVFDFQEK